MKLKHLIAGALAIATSAAASMAVAQITVGVTLSSTGPAADRAAST